MSPDSAASRKGGIPPLLHAGRDWTALPEKV